MTKTKLMTCRSCKEPTIHRIKRSCYKPHSSGSHSGGTKYVMEHCTQCNRRWYDGKTKREIVRTKGEHVVVR